MIPASRTLVTLVLSLLGGTLFSAIGSPLPWLLGPMALVFVGARLLRNGARPAWPGSLRNAALISIGYSIGLSFTRETLTRMGEQLPTMVLMTTALLLFCGALAYGIARVSGLPLPTVLMGCVPGGLSQMLVLAEDTRGVDLTVVTFLQVSRLMMIVFFVPMLVFSPLFAGGAAGDARVVPAGDMAASVSAAAPATWSGLFPGLLPMAAVCIGVALLAQRIRFPSAYLLGPMIATAALHLSGVHGPALPAGLLSAAQLMIGAYVGLLLRPEGLKNKTRIILMAALSSALLLIGACGLSLLLTRLHAITSATAFLSLAPGGMDQMGLIAKEIDADIAIVSCYQLFRTWFIFFAVPPLLRLLFKRIERRATARAIAAAPERQ